MKKIILGLTVAIIAIGAYLIGGRSTIKLGDAGYPAYLVSPVNSSSTISTSPTLVLSGIRTYAVLSNIGSNNVFCSFTNSSTLVSSRQGVLIAPNDRYEITGSNFYAGSVYCITETGTSSLSIMYQ